MKIIFVCHGNICRSPAAEYIFKELAKEKGVESLFNVCSRATSREEIGNDIYPPMKRVLSANGVSFERHFATQITYRDLDQADYIFYMDHNNLYYLNRLFGDSPKYHLITEFNGGHEIEDPWYTDRFKYVYSQIREACLAIINKLTK